MNRLEAYLLETELLFELSKCIINNPESRKQFADNPKYKDIIEERFYNVFVPGDIEAKLRIRRNKKQFPNNVYLKAVRQLKENKINLDFLNILLQHEYPLTKEQLDIIIQREKNFCV
jgi:hypothetical protein